MEDNQKQRAATTLREMERKSHDQIMVHNPSDEPYQFRWNSYITLIPSVIQDKGYGKGNALLDRGVAGKYVTEMTDLILTNRLDIATKEENKRRIESGMNEMTRYEELPVFQTQYRTNDPEQRKAVLSTIWLGVYHEYGMDVPQSADEQMLSDSRPLDEQLLADMNKPYIPQEPIISKEEGDFNNTEALDKKSQFELRSIAKNMGIDVEKTAKKNDIINRIQQP